MKARATSFVKAAAGREVSRDVCAVQSGTNFVIGAVADGAGESEEARWAAEKAVDAVVGNFLARPKGWTIKRALQEFVRIVNRRVYQESMERFGEPRMISTICAVVMESGKLIGVHAGDSRVYRCRRGETRMLTRDHVEGEGSHILVKAVGMAPELEADFFEEDLESDDLVVLCSDGVRNALGDERFHALLKPGLTARTLVESAGFSVEEAERDDLSAVVIEVLNRGPIASEPSLIEWIQPAPGVRVDDFELLSPIHSNGQVWSARRGEQLFVLKFPPSTAREREEEYHRFVREVWQAGRLKSDYLVPVETPENPRYLYVAMPDLKAPSLHEILSKRKLSVEEALALFRFLLDASQFLIGKELVHGDLKPENILVMPDSRSRSFKLIDLGNVAEIFTMTGRAGTPSYLAPERFQGRALSERTELYAIAVTVYQSLTGTFPYGEIEPFQTPVFHSPKPVTKLNPNIPEWLESILLRSLTPDPDRRYQHYSEVRYDLDHPDRVTPFRNQNAPLLERDPLLFYQVGFWLLLGGHFLWLYCRFTK